MSQKSYKDGSSTKGCAEIIIAKHRNGKVKDIGMRFKEEYAKFHEEEEEKTVFDTQIEVKF